MACYRLQLINDPPDTFAGTASYQYQFIVAMLLIDEVKTFMKSNHIFRYQKSNNRFVVFKKNEGLRYIIWR